MGTFLNNSACAALHTKLHAAYSPMPKAASAALNPAAQGFEKKRRFAKGVFDRTEYISMENTEKIVGTDEIPNLMRKGNGLFTFITGTMEAGKSAELLKFAESCGKKVASLSKLPSAKYEQNSKGVSIWGAGCNTRDENCIRSRNGLACRLDHHFCEDTNFEGFAVQHPEIHTFLIDEAQFLDPAQVIQLKRLAIAGKQIYAYGLWTDFQGNAFAASAVIMETADVLKKLVCKCRICSKNTAEINARIMNKRIVKEGAQVQIGDSESYWPVCETCYSKE